MNIDAKLRVIGLKILHKLCCLKHRLVSKKSLLVSGISERPLVVVILSYNNARYCVKNIESVLQQKYTNYRVIFVDDCSSDNTSELVRSYCAQHPQGARVTLHRNHERLYRLGNLYWTVHSCADHEIIVELDGDDYFAHENVLATINSAYEISGALMLHANYKNCPPELAEHMGLQTFSHKTPWPVMRYRLFRYYPWIYSGTRSYYVWLFKRIKKEDFICAIAPFDGRMYPLCDDLAVMLPMLEMAAPRVFYIAEELLLRNIDSPINDFKQYDKIFRAQVREQLLKRDFYKPIKPVL